MNTNLKESTIAIDYQQEVNNQGYLWDPADTFKVFDSVILGITDYLALAKSKKQSTAVAINDLKGNLLFAGIVAYHENENEEMPGNWSYEFTFDPEDIKDAKVVNSTDGQITRFVQTAASNQYNMYFGNPTMIQVTLETFANTLKRWLDQNAREGEEVSVIEEGFFVASAVVENGEKVFSVVPDGAMKKIIKDDAAIEK